MAEGWITGWRNIAAYMGVSLRTAQKRFYQFSLPIRRPAGCKVAALKSEIDTWLVEYAKRTDSNKTFKITRK